MNQTPVTVSQLTNYIKSLLENAPPLQELCLRGEISNYKMHHSGHHYFTLKDENAVINAVMFAGNAAKLRFRPESGMKVIVYGRVSLFAKSGQYQIYVNQMVPDGVGALYIAYEQLKRRLHQEGLFNKSAKKPLPAYPERIALVTSPTGAAVRDMLRILKKRWPLSRVLVCPVKVQGEGAAQQIAEMLDYLGQHQLADLVITGRGGGSLEDLWAFNEEAVARAIYRCPIPVISAVGHEPDITISDYVADLRAATPSNAAELAVPDGEELALRLGDTFSHLAYMEKKRIDALRQRLDTLASKKIMRSPEEYLQRAAAGALHPARADDRRGPPAAGGQTPPVRAAGRHTGCAEPAESTGKRLWLCHAGRRYRQKRRRLARQGPDPDPAAGRPGRLPSAADPKGGIRMAEKFVFERAMKRIEEIVALLEQGSAPLDQSLALFEEGTRLIKQCSSALDKAEQKVSLLVKTPDGPGEEPFDALEVPEE